jgi:hypothetical protein
MSKSLKQQLRGMCHHYREGSFSTQDTRKRILSQVADDLKRLGYRHMRPSSLKAKHVWALVNDWKERDLSLSTVKNRMSAVRWWARHARCPEAVAAKNSHYEIGERTYVATESRATTLPAEKLDRVTDPYIRLSLRLQQEFGLRREESMKFQVRYADQGDHIRLKSSWCKGGRPRQIPVRTAAQRELLDAIRTFTGGGSKVSLIPAELKYVDQLHKYEYQTQQAGLTKMHGLRHAYAQTRYRELTGWACPVLGGPSRTQMSPDIRKIDERVRLQIAEELGHGREEITTVYLGR